MNGTPHPTSDQLERYRRRTASPAETLEVDAHVAACDRCFENVRADAHLTFEELEAIVDGRQAARPHLALCARCRDELADLRQMREALRSSGATGSQPGDGPANRWWPLAAAAMLAAIVVAAWLLFRSAPTETAPAPSVTPAVVETAPATSAPPQQTAVQLERPRILDTLITREAVLRGSGSGDAFALHAPVATVVLDDRPRFRWAAVAGATRYNVAIIDLEPGTVIAGGTSASNSWQPDSPLPRGRTYAWQVTAETSRGRIVAPGRDAAEARFHVATQSSVAGTSPRERGIALAALGALDDAERELRQAQEEELLQQVRAWRAQRVLPTTTNGAQ